MLCACFTDSAASVVTATTSDPAPAVVPAIANTWNSYVVSATSPVTTCSVPATASPSYPGTTSRTTPSLPPAPITLTSTDSRKNRFLEPAPLHITATSPSTPSNSFVNVVLSDSTAFV